MRSPVLTVRMAAAQETLDATKSRSYESEVRNRKATDGCHGPHLWRRTGRRTGRTAVLVGRHAAPRSTDHGSRRSRGGGLTPQLDCRGVRHVGTQRVASPNYLFIDLELAPDLAPGSCDIRLRSGDHETTVSYHFERRRPGSASRQGFMSADVIYLVMPDRFANGDPDNDSVPEMRERADRTNPDGRHGGDLQGIIDHLDYIADMGYTQVWLNPILENNEPTFSYHGYSTTDYYRVDPRFGDNELYREFAAEARQRGMGIIMDLIPNHSGVSHWWVEDPPTARLDQSRHLRANQSHPGAAVRPARGRHRPPVLRGRLVRAEHAGPQSAQPAAGELPHPERDLVGGNRRLERHPRRYLVLRRQALPGRVDPARHGRVPPTSTSSARSGTTIPASSRTGNGARGATTATNPTCRA